MPPKTSKSKTPMSAKIRSDMFGASINLPRVVEVDLSKIRPNPEQPRKFFDDDALIELAGSIEQKGLLQPILIKSIGDEEFLLVAGERRYRAHQILNRASIPAIVTDGDTDEIALIENLQREELRPIEIAEALDHLMKTHQYTQEDVSKVIGKARNTVTELLSLVKLPEVIRHECRTSDIASKSVLVELAKMSEADQMEAWSALKEGSATVKEIRSARSKNTEKSQDKAQPVVFDKAVRSLRGAIGSIGNTQEKFSEMELEVLVSIRAELDQLIERASQNT